MFIFKGKNSNDMGVYVREENFLGKAPMRYDSIEIEGKHGADLVELGYQNFEGTLNDVVIMNDNFDEALKWLSGTGELIYMGKKTRIHFLDGYQVAKHKKTFSIPFIREPFWYKLDHDYSEAWGANLILNGWDSFEPYGSGRNYVENWDFSTGDLSHWQGSYGVHKVINGVYTKEITEANGTARAEYYTVMPTGNYIARIKIKSNKKVSVRNWNNIKENVSSIIEPSGDFSVWEKEINVISDTDNLRLRFYVESSETSKGQVFEIDWIQITPVDNQHLVVEKTPLENGLTRIQTWGGNVVMKLLHWSKDTDEYITKSVNLENIGDNSVEIDPNTYGESVIVRGGEKKHVVITGKRQNPAARNQFKIRALNVSHSLDFIASTPIIVEGDKPPTWEADENPRIVNEGTAPAQPLIKLTKGTSSTCEFEVNDVYFKYHFSNDDHVIIDCDEMNATYKGLPRNRHLTIGFEFPVLEPGPNVVKRISGDAKIEFKRKDRWL